MQPASNMFSVAVLLASLQKAYAFNWKYCCDVYRYLLEKKSDDSILLVLIIRIMDALGNYGIAESLWRASFLKLTSYMFFSWYNTLLWVFAGSLEYDEWYNHRQAWKLESAAIVEPPANFITEFHSKGKRR